MAEAARRVVALAGEIIGREGRLVAVVEAMGPPALGGALVRLPLDLRAGGAGRK